MKITIKEKKIHQTKLIETKNSSSYIDPNGFVFEQNNDIFRAIRKKKELFYRKLFEEGIIDTLVTHHHLVPSVITDMETDADDIGFVIHHQRIEPKSYCVEWCPAMLLDAASVIVDLLCELCEKNCILQDAYPWNILFSGTKPVFIDLTSIVEIETPLIWPAYDQFQAFFLRPLELSAQGKGNIARMLLYNNISGISRSDFYQNSTFFYNMMHPLSGLNIIIDKFIQRNRRLKNYLRFITEQDVTRVDNKIRVRFYKGLKQKLNSYRFDTQNNVWSTYYEGIGPDIDKKSKLQVVGDLIYRIHPKTVTDIGCNTGAFSVLAAQNGSRVISIDSSEACISRLYTHAKTSQLNITPLISDLLCPTPPFGFLGKQYSSLIERAKAECVLCLALMHHLHITGRQSFDRIALLLDALSSQHLIFEFVDLTDANNELLGRGRLIDYSLPSVIAELKRYFSKIEIFKSDRETRKILLCSKEKS